MTFTDLFKQKYKKLSSNEIKQKEELVNRIIPKIDCTNKALLLIGQVQSGKTSTYLYLISKMFDENRSNLCIVFSGVDKKINKQTFDIFSDMIISCDGKNGEARLYGSDKYLGKIELVNKIHDAIDEGKKVLIVSLKHYKHVEKVYEVFKNLSKGNIKNPFIIDDEGDQATFYNLNYYKKTKEHTATYKNFSLFKEISNSFTFISVTATPFAHILVSNDCWIKPQYAFILNPGDGYMGLNYIFCNNTHNILNIIPDKEIQLFKKTNYINNSLKKALIEFLFNSFIYEKRKNNGKIQTKFLINIARQKNIHESISDQIEEFFQQINNTPSILDEYIAKLKTTYLFSKDKIKDIIWKIIAKQWHKIKVINNDYSDNSINDDDFESRFQIIIGSQMIQRGIDFQNLLSCYILNDKSTYTCDNDLQKARFFGYRKEYEDLMRVYISNRVSAYFNIVASVDSELRSRLQYYENNNLSLANLERMISYDSNKNTLNLGLIGTRLTIAKQKVSKSHIEFNDYNFDFTGNTRDIEKNEKMEGIFNVILKDKNWISSSKQFNKLNFGKYPTLKFKSWEKTFAYFDRHNIDIKNILIDYFGNNPVLKEMFVDKELSIIFALMIYDLKDNRFSNRKITYNEEKQKYSYYREGSNVNYVGDNEWLNDEKKKVLIQIYPLDPPNKYKNNIKQKAVYKVQLMTSKDKETEKIYIVSE